MRRTILLALALVFVASGVAYADNYGVVFSGGADANNNHDRYYDNTKRIWELWTGPLGYSTDNVYVLFADGTDPGIDRSSGQNSDWSFIPTGHILEATDDKLESLMLSMQGWVTEEDCFHFWSFDHGYGSADTPDTGGLVAWGNPWIDDDVFAGWANAINGYAESYWFGQCYAGDMADDLEIKTGENRFAAWAAGWWESSWGDGWIDALADGIERGLRSTHDLAVYAIENDPFGPLGTGREHPGYTGADFHVITNEPIPEPSTASLIAFGLAAAIIYRRRRKP
jgi:hypothetical protein